MCHVWARKFKFTDLHSSSCTITFFEQKFALYNNVSFSVCPLAPLLDRSLYYLKSKVGVRLNPPWPHSLFSSLFGMGKIHKRGKRTEEVEGDTKFFSSSIAFTISRYLPWETLRLWTRRGPIIKLFHLCQSIYDNNEVRDKKRRFGTVWKNI